MPRKKLLFAVIGLIFMLCTTTMLACDKVEFIINFECDGEIIDSINTNGQEVIAMPENPTKENHEFEGWYWDKDVWEKPFTANSLLDAPLTSDMTVYARFTHTCIPVIDSGVEATYSSTGLTQGSHCSICYRIITPQEIIPIKKPSIVTAKNCSITGNTLFMFVDKNTEVVQLADNFTTNLDSIWELYRDKLCTNKITSKVTSQLENGNNTYYVKVANQYAENVYNLTIHRSYQAKISYLDNNSIELHSEYVYTGSTFAPAYTPYIKGYIFNNWNDASEKIINNHTVWGNEYYYANKTKKSFTAILNTNGGSASIPSMPVTYDEEFFFGTASKENYIFQGWSYNGTLLTDNQGRGLSTWNIDSNSSSIILTASYIEKPYNVYLNSNLSGAGQVIGRGSYRHSNPVTISAITNDGYTFLGWYDGDTKISQNPSLSYTFTMPIHDVTYTAKWTPCTVTIEKSYSDAGGYTAPLNKTIAGAQTTITASNVYNKSYTWLGWYDGDTKVSEGSSMSYTFIFPSTPKTYTAKWIPCPVKLESNMPQAGNILPLTGTIAGVNATAKAETRAGYTWLGWYDGDTKVSTGNDLNYTFIMPEEEKTYTAKWSKITIACEGNGGWVQSLTGKYFVGDTTTISVSSSYAGYTWLGWYDGDTKVSIANEQSYTFAMPAENKTYIAKWCKQTITQNIQAAGTTTQLNGKYNVGDNVTIKVLSTNLGYEFDGWYDGDILLTTDTTYNFNLAAENKSYTAKWHLLEGLEAFNFSSTPTTATILSVKDTTATEIIVPSYVTHISEGALKNCSSVEELTIPFVGNTLKTENDTYQYPFGYIFGRTSFDNTAKTTQNYYGISTTSLTTTDYYIPQSLARVTIVGGEILYGAFYGCKITTVSISSNIEKLTDSAFYAAQVTTVELPNTLQEIESNAFYTARVKYVNFPDSLVTIGEKAFYNSYITNIIIPNSTETIGASAFENCYLLQTVHLSNKIVTINEKTFAGCSTLQTVTFADNSVIETIDANAFYGCINLLSFVVPKSLTTIGQYAFYNCKNSPQIAFEDNSLLTNIGSSAFSKSNAIINWGENSSLKHFRGFSSYLGETIAIPNGVTEISEVAGCPNLKTITLPAGLEKINNGSFENCVNLESLTIPASVTAIGMEILIGCTNLKILQFEDANNWYITQNSTYWAEHKNGSAYTDLKDSTKNAERFMSARYSTTRYFWYKN